MIDIVGRLGLGARSHQTEALGMSIITAACMIPTVSWAEYLGDSILQSALENCLPAVIVEGGKRFEHLTPLTGDDVTSVASLGEDEKAWASKKGEWVLVQGPFGSRTCVVKTLDFDLLVQTAEWNAFLAGSETRYRHVEDALTVSDDWGSRACGMASRPTQDGFVELGFCALEPHEGIAQAFVLVDHVTVPRPETCDVWPKECEK